MSDYNTVMRDLVVAFEIHKDSSFTFKCIFFLPSLEMNKIKEWTFVGEGSYGRVTRAHVASTRQNVAVKWIPVKHLPGHLTGQMDLDIEPPQEAEDDNEDATEYHEALEEFIIASLLGTTKAPAFLHFYGAFIASFSSSFPPQLPQALASLIPEKPLGQQYYLVQVSEYASVGTLDTLLRHGYEFPVAQASAIAFELVWSFMIAHSNVGLRWHGDLQSRNIVFMSLTPIDPISYELVTMDERSLGRWSHTQRLRPCVIDFGFASYIVPNKMSVLGADVATNTPPELYFNVPNNRSDRTDVWQLAILFFSLFAPQTTRLLKIRHDLNRGRSISKHDDYLNKSLNKRFIDLIDLPLYWISMLAEERGLTPPKDDNDDDYMMVLEDDNDDAQAIMLSEQMNLGSRFVNLLYSLDDVCTSELANDLQQEDAKGRKFARYISIGLLQSVLGNGWHPSPEEAERMGYDQSAFYHCLLHPKVQAFWNRYILPPDMKLMIMMQGMVGRLPVPVRALMKRMMRWSPFDRPSCQDIVLDPWFASQLQPPPLSESIMYRVHARPILRMKLSLHATEQEKQQWIWLAKKHAKLKQKFQKTSSVADSLEEVETLVEKSVL
jgi:serine/threonine protein kinase